MSTVDYALLGAVCMAMDKAGPHVFALAVVQVAKAATVGVAAAAIWVACVGCPGAAVVGLAAAAWWLAR